MLAANAGNATSRSRLDGVVALVGVGAIRSRVRTKTFAIRALVRDPILAHMVKLTRAIRVTQARLVLTFVVIGWAAPLARGRELSVEWFFTAIEGPWVPPGRTKYAA